MDIEDIPILRHLRLAGGLLKATIVLFGWIILFLYCFDYIDRYKNRSHSQDAKWYYALRAIMWGGYAWAFSLVGIGILAKALDIPGPVSGNWIFITWIYCKPAGIAPDKYMLYDCAVAILLGTVMYAWSWYFGKESSSGDFIDHTPY